MRIRLILASKGVAALAAIRPATTSASTYVAPAGHYTPHVHILKPHANTNVSPFSDTRGGSPPLLFRGGPVMKTDYNYAIYWKPTRLQDVSTVTGGGPAFQSLINRWFADASQTGVYATTTQYYGTTRVHPHTTSFGAAYIDTTPYPSGHCIDRYTGSNCITDADIQAEVHKVAAAHGFGPSNGRSFFVFTQRNEGSCIDGSATSQCAYSDYCAYHGPSVTAAGITLYANMPYPVASTISDCPGTSISPNNNVVADAEISIVSHEQMESVTDPEVNYNSAWYDAAGYENGDECAYQYGPSIYAGGGDVTGNGHSYEVQSEGDNARADCSVVGP